MAYESSDDDVPLSKANGHVSAAKISKEEDRAMDKSASKARPGPTGISIRNGPVVDAMDIDSPNGAPKRKSRSSIGQAVNYKDESDSDDGAPLAKRQKSKHKKKEESDSDDEPIAKRNGKLPPSIKDIPMGELSDDDDEPLGTKLAQKKASIEKAAAKEAKSVRAADSKAKKATPKKPIKEESDDDDEPLSKPKKRQSNGVASANKMNGVKKQPESDSDEPIAKKAAKKPTAAAAKGKAPPKKAAKFEKESSKDGADEEEEEEEFRWWDAPKKEDDSIKWTTLEHNGVIFPPPYEPLPKDIKLYYDGKPVALHVEAEEVATFFGSMLHSTQNVENEVFQKNFFLDFKEVLRNTGGAKDLDGNKVDIKEFKKLDFTKIFEHYKALSDAKKARPAAEKKAEKAERDKIEAPFLYCKWDGRKEKIGNPRVEPPGLFRGRGEHPKTGKVKKRVMPEQITINIGKDAKIPSPPPGHKWKAVQHDNKATWLAMWQENVNGNYKYIMLAANSAVKGQADFKKFEKARELKKHIDKIRRDYEKELKSDVMADRQRATAMYLIDKFALRAGNEKDTENEAETVGCCSLKYEHVILEEPDTVIFDFLGKDSIRFHQEVKVQRQVFKNLKMFKKAPKEDGDDIFDRLTTTQLNKHLSSYMPGLTAKVFRTYNASYTMSYLLQKLKIDQNIPVAEKIKLYNDCNREVAILCNHKRTVGAGHEAQMEKLGDRIKGLKYQKWRVKQMMLSLDPKLKKKKGAEYFALDEDLDQDWIESHQNFLVEEQRAKIEKKFEKDNEKLQADGESKLTEKVLKERLEVATELEAKFKKENKTKKIEPEGKGATIEKLEAQVEKIDGRINVLQLQSADREGNKEVALGTSKINYIDPRLTVVFAAKANVPIEKFFSKTLRDKFKWAIESVGDDETWEF
ncbi:DNA topoisomerase 1 [Podospora aff. communis PSN243]|uniref:DNA topoisomerase I n=1 Tax=Podospora aff. communis PSN243 TaxID=3040156 RepID=A0AAV9GWR2_9PEZI|nr:DNA topoisomerase 1 [Podospora aff. communis PSN243]